MTPDKIGSLEENIGIAIRDIGIPPRPTVLSEIESEMAKDEPDFTHLAKVISADVALSAALLRTANSPYFGLDKKVRSVPEALLLLGLNLTIRTIAGISLQKVFERAPHLERYWDESGTTARVSGWLAKRLRKSCWVRPEDAYTFGLFHDCGIPVIMAPFPQYRSVLAKANAEKAGRFTDVENRMIGTNHAEMGAMLAESWSLPPEIIEAIRYHHHLDQLIGGEVPEAADMAVPLIAMTQLAEHLVYRRTGSRNTFEWDKVSEIAKRTLNIDDAKIDELFEECHEPMAGFFD
jgi:HD-like signal output (HDOD) protein